jgi:hypothetical protein
MYKLFARHIVTISLLLNVYHSAFALTEKQAKMFFHLNPHHSVKFLDIKGYQQTTDYTCAPAVVMSLYDIIKDSMNNK